MAQEVVSSGQLRPQTERANCDRPPPSGLAPRGQPPWTDALTELADAFGDLGAAGGEMRKLAELQAGNLNLKCEIEAAKEQLEQCELRQELAALRQRFVTNPSLAATDRERPPSEPPSISVRRIACSAPPRAPQRNCHAATRVTTITASVTSGHGAVCVDPEFSKQLLPLPMALRASGGRVVPSHCVSTAPRVAAPPKTVAPLPAELWS